METPDVEARRASTLAKMQAKFRLLPCLPSVAMRIAHLLATADDQFDQIERVAREDPTLATRILQCANSAANAPLEPVLTVDKAVTWLGSRRITELLTSVTVMRVFLPTREEHRRLWMHSIQTAVAARSIAEVVPGFRDRLGEVYMCGLLHDIGRFVMFDQSPRELGAVEETRWTTPADLILQERRICGYDHAELGASALVSWQIPEEIAAVVRHHHVYGAVLDETAGPLAEVVRVVQQADHLSVGLLAQPDIAEASASERLRWLSRTCWNARWGPPPAPPQGLLPRLGDIARESAELIEELGLFPTARRS